MISRYLVHFATSFHPQIQRGFFYHACRLWSCTLMSRKGNSSAACNSQPFHLFSLHWLPAQWHLCLRVQEQILIKPLSTVRLTRTFSSASRVSRRKFCAIVRRRSWRRVSLSLTRRGCTASVRVLGHVTLLPSQTQKIAVSLAT
jgi:hypothetical protein